MDHECDIDVIGIAKSILTPDATWVYHVIQVEEGLNLIITSRMDPGSEALAAMSVGTDEDRSTWFNERFFGILRETSHLWPRADPCPECRAPGEGEWTHELLRHVSATYDELVALGVRRVDVQDVPSAVSLEWRAWQGQLWETDAKDLN
jgi:hypothetical protein